MPSVGAKCVVSSDLAAVARRAEETAQIAQNSPEEDLFVLCPGAGPLHSAPSFSGGTVQTGSTVDPAELQRARSGGHASCSAPGELAHGQGSSLSRMSSSEHVRARLRTCTCRTVHPVHALATAQQSCFPALQALCRCLPWVTCPQYIVMKAVCLVGSCSTRWRRRRGWSLWASQRAALAQLQRRCGRAARWKCRT